MGRRRADAATSRRIAELQKEAERNRRDAERERQLAAAEERTRIARELHDSAGHAINVILVHAGLGRMRAEGGAASTREEFETIERVARDTVGEIDQLIGALRADSADGGDEPAAPPRALSSPSRAAHDRPGDGGVVSAFA